MFGSAEILLRLFGGWSVSCCVCWSVERGVLFLPGETHLVCRCLCIEECLFSERHRKSLGSFLRPALNSRSLGNFYSDASPDIAVMPEANINWTLLPLSMVESILTSLHFLHYLATSSPLSAISSPHHKSKDTNPNMSRNAYQDLDSSRDSQEDSQLLDTTKLEEAMARHKATVSSLNTSRTT